MGLEAEFIVNGEEIDNYRCTKSKTLLFKNVTEDDHVDLEYDFVDGYGCYSLDVFILDVTTKKRYSRKYYTKNTKHTFWFPCTLYEHDVELYICMNGTNALSCKNAGPFFKNDLEYRWILDDDDAKHIRSSVDSYYEELYDVFEAHIQTYAGEYIFKHPTFSDFTEEKVLKMIEQLEEFEETYKDYSNGPPVVKDTKNYRKQLLKELIEHLFILEMNKFQID